MASSTRFQKGPVCPVAVPLGAVGFFRFLSVFLLCLGVAPFAASAQSGEPAAPDPPPAVMILPEISVSSVRSRKQPSDVPASLSTVPAAEIQTARPTLTLDEALIPLPGLFFQNRANFAQDLRISIRGFGARAPFGVRGVKVLVDGIPQTLADGQTPLDAIDPGLLRSIEVRRGPAASLYGNASGGVLALETASGAEDTPLELAPRFLAGSYGLRKYQTSLGGSYEGLNHRIFASHLKFEGYRNHSATENTLVNGKFGFTTPAGTDWTLILSHFNSPLAEDPGALTREEAEADPEQANARNLLFSAGEQVREETFGLRLRKDLTTGLELTLTPYFRQRNFSNKLPFVSGGIVEFERLAPGMDVKTVWDTSLGGRRARFLAGVDFAFQRDDRKRFDNLQSRRGALTLDQVETVYSIGPYVRQELKYNSWLDLAAGLRYDRVHFDLDDNFLSDGGQSGSRTLSEWSGSIGAVAHAAPGLDVYANVATVFEVPTTTELIVDPSGGPGFNPDLDAQRSVSYEIGVKGRLSPALHWDAAVFFIESEDEIIPFELPGSPGRNFFRNAGQSERLGFEGSLRYRPTNLGGSLSVLYLERF